ncbi:MAG: hypothetical protein BWY02_02674 [bacterium ADurb.Bin157]|nr:MAG: hypothetical protein BWY02_02674 [bacterium ADurb.Bin157]
MDRRKKLELFEIIRRDFPARRYAAARFNFLEVCCGAASKFYLHLS